jgi:hypothetical protein
MSHSSTNSSLVNTGDLRLESITPRKAAGGHSRQNSLSSLHEIANEKSGKSHSRQASLSSVMDDYSQKDKENMLKFIVLSTCYRKMTSTLYSL